MIAKEKKKPQALLMGKCFSYTASPYLHINLQAMLLELNYVNYSHSSYSQEARKRENQNEKGSFDRYVITSWRSD